MISRASLLHLFSIYYSICLTRSQYYSTKNRSNNVYLLHYSIKGMDPKFMIFWMKTELKNFGLTADTNEWKGAEQLGKIRTPDKNCRQSGCWRFVEGLKLKLVKDSI